MKYYRFNQIAMAVLGALLLFFGTRTLINIVFEENEPEKPGYEVPGGNGEKPGGGEQPGGGGNAELASLLAKGSAEKGAEVAKKCAICHNFDKGGPNMIGPDLYGVVGRKIASHEGYEYSDALKAKKGDWTYDNLFEWLKDPNAWAPGTKMALFPGLPEAKDRADVILFLRTKSDNPPPLPEVTAEKPGGEGEKPGGGEGGDAAFLALIAKADPKEGEADTALCKVCHTFNKGGAALIGPNLYGVVGRKIASFDDFNYTPALKAHEGDWTYDKLNLWLKNPQEFAPGTAMAFPGLPDDKKRAAVIAYLRSNADNPVPLPETGGAPGGATPEEKGTTTPPATGEEKGAPEGGTPPAAGEQQAPSTETPPATEETKPEGAPQGETPPATEETKPEGAGETPPAAGEQQAPSTETPPAATEEQAPSTETPPATEEQAPSTETPPAATEQQTPPTETPPATEETKPETAPQGETPPAATEEQAPLTETPPAATEEQAPSTETPPPATEEQAPSTETPPTGTETPPTTGEEPSPGEAPNPSWPQPTYPDGPPEGVSAPSDGGDASTGETTNPSWPQPTYPDGPPPGL
jgi:cytochrome c